MPKSLLDTDAEEVDRANKKNPFVDIGDENASAGMDSTVVILPGRASNPIHKETEAYGTLRFEQ